jgi:hypothetical protein
MPAAGFVRQGAGAGPRTSQSEGSDASSREEMHLAGYPDNRSPIDCANEPTSPRPRLLSTFNRSRVDRATQSNRVTTRTSPAPNASMARASYFRPVTTPDRFSAEFFGAPSGFQSVGRRSIAIACRKIFTRRVRIVKASSSRLGEYSRSARHDHARHRIPHANEVDGRPARGRDGHNYFRFHHPVSSRSVIYVAIRQNSCKRFRLGPTIGAQPMVAFDPLHYRSPGIYALHS